MRTITLEEHFASPAFFEGPGREFAEQARQPNSPMAAIPAQLIDLGGNRLAQMDAAGIEMQVLSLNAPGVEQLDPDAQVALAKESNEYVAKAMKAYPKRFSAFAALPVLKPDLAASELERLVHDENFCGANINGHVRGRYLDDKFFWPIFECAEAIGAPIYLHPTPPPQPVIDAWFSGFTPGVTNILARAGYGWHIETAIHVVRLILGGVFDRYPHLQIIVGHMGETLPSMLQRMDRSLNQKLTKLERPVGAYLRENVYYTFSGFNFTPVFLNLLTEVGVDRIMFSADYPYSSMETARRFLDNLPVSTADRERIAHGNAARLLKL
jgi:predicted TIM-barrel fold metal-dependent hydrolase